MIDRIWKVLFSKKNEETDIQTECDVKRLQKILHIAKVIGSYRWSKDKCRYKQKTEDESKLQLDNVDLLVEPADIPSMVDRKRSWRWQIREYFIERPDHEIEKYIDGDDVMIEDHYVYVESEIPTTPPDANHYKVAFIDFSSGSIG